MAKRPMKKLELLALAKDRDALLKTLQKAGVMELKRAETEGWQQAAQAEWAENAEEEAQAAQQAVEILRALRPEKQRAWQKSRGAWRITPAQAQKMEAHGALYRRQCQEVIRLDAALAERTAERARISERCAQLRPWTRIEMPLGGLITKHTVCRVGSVMGQWTEEELLQAIWKQQPRMDALCVQTAPGPLGHTLAAVACLRREEEDLQNALAQMGFAPCPFRGKESAAGQLAKAELALREAEDEIERLKHELMQRAARPEGILFAADMLAAVAQRQRAMDKLAFSEKTVAVAGYVPADEAGRLLDRLCRRFPLAYELSDAGEDAPVLLKNNRFVRPVESITKMYALPGPKDIDPSGVMAFFYYVFFGMMLSDAGYGLVMVLGTTWALGKLTLKREMAETLRMFRYCGVSTVVWGALFGSWFGDIVQVIGRSFFSVEIGSLALWFEPMADPIRLLLFAFALGIVHLCAGLFVRAGMLIKQRRAWDAVMDTLPVLLLVLGAAPLAAGIFIPVPEGLTGAGKGMAAAGAVLLIFTSGRSGKKALAKLGGGLYGLYNTASGYLSDVLSYSRLLALGLATGRIAGVVNLMGAMPENLAVKAVVLTVVFCVGHAVNLAINLLGAYVHTNRLQFVELFSKFYEGGGRAFAPFAAPQGYTHIEEETK